MDDLSNPELGLLKSLLSGRPLPTEAQTSIVDALRSKAPDFFSQFTSDLTEEKRKDNYSVFKHLTKNRDKIKIALNKAKYFSANQQTDLINALEKPVATEAVIYQQGQGPTEQTASGTATGGSGGGMPSMPSVSVPAVHPIFRTKPPVTETPKPDIAPLQKPDIPSGRKLNIPSVRNSFSTGFKNLQNFAAPANPFLKTNLNRIGQGFKSMFGNLGGAGLNALGRGLNLGGNAAGRLSNFKSSMGGRIKGVGNRGSSLVKGGGRKFALASGLGFLLFFLIAMSGNMTGTTPIGNAAPPAPVPAPPGPITPPGPPGTHPVAPKIDPSQLRTSLIAKFGIQMDGFDSDHLRMAWEKFWDVSNTNFIKLVSGSVIKYSAADSAQIGCPGNPGGAVIMNQFLEELFKYALIHELGHVIRNCVSDYTVNQKEEHSKAFAKEGGVTYYANNAYNCTKSDNASEDYAEMITRYLTPETNIQLIKSRPENKCTPPPTESVDLKNSFPMHYNVAKSVLGDY